MFLINPFVFTHILFIGIKLLLKQNQNKNDEIEIHETIGCMLLNKKMLTM